MPRGLPPARVTGAGVLVPLVHWGAVTRLRDGWAQYPGLCRGVLDDLGALWTKRAEVAARIAAIRLAKKNLQRATGWSTWKVGLAITGSVLGGGLIGFLAGVIVMVAQ